MNRIRDLRLSVSHAADLQFAQTDDPVCWCLSGPDPTLRVDAVFVHAASASTTNCRVSASSLGPQGWWRQAASVEAHSCTRRQSSSAIGRIRSETPLIWQGYRRLPAAFRVTTESVPSPRFRPCLTACRSGVVLHPLPARFTTWPPTISHEMPTSRVPSPVDALLSSRDRRPKSQCNMSTATETALSWRDPAALDGRIRSP